MRGIQYGFPKHSKTDANVAQLVEQLIRTQQGTGSSPVISSRGISRVAKGDRL